MIICQGKLTKLDTGCPILVIKRGFRKLRMNRNCDILNQNNFFSRGERSFSKNLKKVIIYIL